MSNTITHKHEPLWERLAREAKRVRRRRKLEAIGQLAVTLTITGLVVAIAAMAVL